MNLDEGSDGRSEVSRASADRKSTTSSIN